MQLKTVRFLCEVPDGIFMKRHFHYYHGDGGDDDDGDGDDGVYFLGLLIY